MGEHERSEQTAWPDGYRAAAVVTFDVDAESGVLCEMPEAAERLGLMSHQAYGPRAGLPRLLRILRRHEVRATFFIPGLTAQMYPDTVRAIVEDGHEVAAHGYLHEEVSRLSASDEEELLERTVEILANLTGSVPLGWRAPMWDMGYRTPALLASQGFAYDSSLMDDDRPYRLATGPRPSDPVIVELPPHWSLDDGEQYAWLPGIWDTATISSPLRVVEMWSLELAAVVREGGCLVLTMHPCLSGRPGRALAFEGLLEQMVGTSGVMMATAAQVAEHVAALPLPPVYHAPPPIDVADASRPSTFESTGSARKDQS